MNSLLQNLIESLATIAMLDVGLVISFAGNPVRIKPQNNTGWRQVIFGEEIKETRVLFTLILSNIIGLIVWACLKILDIIVGEAADTINLFDDLDRIITLGTINLMLLILIGCVIITFIFYIIIYRLIPTQPMAYDGNRHFNSDEIDKEYLDFCKSGHVDSRSELYLIGGDLSFLGDVPTLNLLENEANKKNCKNKLEKIALCTRKKCINKRQVNLKCIAKSEQLIQLFQLTRNSGVTINILCKRPNAIDDSIYSQRLGLLAETFGSKVQIRFRDDEIMNDQFCILGRIKRNGDVDELLYHWKDTAAPKSYTTPAIKRADTSENKTLICLLKMLWDISPKAETQLLDECIKKFHEALEMRET